MSKIGSLHWVDYLLFASMLLVSMAIGIYHSLAGGYKKTTSEYLMASRYVSASSLKDASIPYFNILSLFFRQMAMLPTVLSLMVSFMSSILMLGKTF